ncbi:MAG: hypothetical protein FJW39_01670 [Acidobacteria bacterium]|nr:hypothetical protein [Acidobacteriota bacterium]
MIKAVINVAAPRYHVYQVLTDYEKYKQWLPNCTGSVIASREGNRVDTDITVNMMKTVTMGLRFESDGAHSLTFSLLKSSDLKGYSGSYRLMDAADGVGTVVITEMDLDAGGMVPRFMVDRMAKKSIDDTGNALREYIKKLPPPAAPPPAAAGAVEAAKPAPVAARPKRARRVLRVRKTASGYQIWYMGREFEVKG